MYFDFEDYRPDITPVGQVISWREGVLLSIIAHMGLIIAVLLMPRWFPYDPQQAEQLVEASRPEDNPRFVIVNPKVDLEALRPPDLAPLSDKNREARTPEPVVNPENPLPALRGNSFNRVEETQPEIARGRGPGPEPAIDQPSDAPAAPASADAGVSQPRVPDSQSALALPGNPAPAQPRRALGGGALGDALRNLDRYVKNEQFENSKGGAEFGQFQFDTKGVEFGPWVRRFAAQVQRNWDPLIPDGPMMLRKSGHVVITLNIHKNGSITDVAVAEPCAIEGFNTAAYGALVSSNPTQPLPPEYPAEKAFFTITFYYNERPPDR